MVGAPPWLQLASFAPLFLACALCLVRAGVLSGGWRLEGWIDSPVPLLGVAAEAGSGKTGILANLTRTWIAGGDRPVLLLLARDFQTQGTLDLAIREALHLREASTSGRAASQSKAQPAGTS